MTMTENPCRGCPDRFCGDEERPNCHVTCQRYKGWKDARDSEKAKQSEEAAKEYRFRSYKQLVYDRNKVRRKKSTRKEQD